MSEVLTGSVDWNVKQWRESFYPEDIPEDWLLGYYANEFLTTVLDAEQLVTEQQREELGEQLTDCHEGFRPVLHWDTRTTSIERVVEVLGWLKDQDEDLGLSRLAGIWISTVEPVDELDKLREYRSAIDATVPISAQISADLWTSREKEIEALRVFPLVDSEAGASLSTESWLMLVSLDSPSRDLAAEIRDFLEPAGSSEIICVLARQGYEDIDKLQGLETIIRLTAG